MTTKNRLYDARAALGETQAEFALRFGVDQSTIHRWETLGLPRRGAAGAAVAQFLARHDAAVARRRPGKKKAA